MAFLVSPGVHVRETDATNRVPQLGTSTGAICGPFKQGPVKSLENHMLQILSGGFALQISYNMVIL